MIELERSDGLVPPGFERALGGRTGLLAPLYLKPPYRGAPKAYQTATTRTDIEYLVGYDHELELGASGKGVDLANSITSCVGETLERYSLCWPDEADLLRADYDSLAERERVVDFEYLDPFDPAFRDRHLAECTRETEVLWTAGTDLTTGESVYVPAERVWMRVGPLANEPAHFFGSSNGVAAGQTLESALLAAALERIERDGIMRTWWEGQTPDRIDLSTIPALRSYLEEHVPHDDVSVELFASDSVVDVPTYGSAFVRSSDEFPTFGIAGSAALDRESALFEAATEVLQGWPYLHDLAVQYDPSEFEIDEVADDFTRNVLYYAYPEQFEDVAFLLEGPERPPERSDELDANEQSVERRLATVVDRLDDAGCTPIAFDVTAPDVRECGTHVARVYVPELVGLTPPAGAPVGHPAIDDDAVIDTPHPFP